MNNYLIKSGRIIDPSQKIDSLGDILILDGIIADIRTSNPTWEDLGEKLGREIKIIDAKGTVVCPGFVDAHWHLREPGFEHKETISSGTRFDATDRTPRPPTLASGRVSESSPERTVSPPPHRMWISVATSILAVASLTAISSG